MIVLIGTEEFVDRMFRHFGDEPVYSLQGLIDQHQPLGQGDRYQFILQSDYNMTSAEFDHIIALEKLSTKRHIASKQIGYRNALKRLSLRNAAGSITPARVAELTEELSRLRAFEIDYPTKDHSVAIHADELALFLQFYDAVTREIR